MWPNIRAVAIITVIRMMKRSRIARNNRSIMNMTATAVRSAKISLLLATVCRRLFRSFSGSLSRPAMTSQSSRKSLPSEYSSPRFLRVDRLALEISVTGA